MTLLEHFKPKPQNGQPRMPRGPQLPQSPPSAPPPRPRVEEYADEAKRAAQRYLDQVTELEVLKEEADAWRNRCSVLEMQITELRAEQQRLVAELDEHKAAIAVISSQYAIASKIFLEGVNTIAQLGASPSPNVNMAAMAAAIAEKPSDPVDPIGADGMAELTKHFSEGGTHDD
jgi:septal ring factor EnvC (AmiA/AmiB activator)